MQRLMRALRACCPALSEDDFPIVLAFIGVAAVVCAIPPEPDTFFHLGSGQSIWQSASIPTTEPFSHTFYGRPWLNHEWLSQLMAFGLYSAGGPLLLTIASGACAFLALLVSWRQTRGSAEVRLVALLALLVMTPAEWAVRPQALSLLLLTCVMWLVVRDRIMWLPVVIVAWANAHGVVLFGVVVACVNALESLIWSRRHFPRALTVAALCAAAPMASPLGWHYWTRVAQTVAEARLLGVQEYRSAFADASSLPFWLVLGVLVVTAALRVRRVAEWDRADRLLVLTSGALGVAAILSIRNAPSFALIAVPAISRLVAVSGRRRVVPLRRAGYTLLAVAAAITMAVIGFRWRDGGSHLGWRPFSPAALTAMRGCSGPMYNEYSDGGTLIWFLPEHRVFVDGRLEAYPPEFLLRVKGADLAGRYHDLFAQYAIRCAVTRTGSVLARALHDDPAMRLEFSDDGWSVFASSGLSDLAAR